MLTALQRAQRLDSIFKDFAKRTSYLRALIAGLENKFDALVQDGQADQAEQIAIQLKLLTHAADAAEAVSVLIYKKAMSLRAEHYGQKRQTKTKLSL